MRTTGILVRKRLTWLFLFCAFALSGLVFRLAWIQFVHGDDLQKMAMDVRMREIPVEAMRGNIYDRNGKELVTSVSVDSVYALPHQVGDQGKTADILAPVLDMDREKLFKILSRRSSYEWIKRKVPAVVAAKIKELKLQGIYMVEESQRNYIHETLAPHLLGITGVDNQGLMGVEKNFDEALSGEPGKILVEHDAAGRKLPDPIHKYIPPQKGNSLVLTIDETIQYFVERELDNVVDRYQPKLAVVMVMDPKTGEMLAMGNRPTFNSNDWKNVPKSVWDRNPAIWYNYEPGSTFKIITASAAVNEKTVKNDDRFYDPGYVKVADRNIHCWKAGGHGSQTFEEVVMNSCNVGFVEVGLGLGKDRFYKYVRGFGFGQTTGIDLPGEAKGIVIPEKNVTNLNVATMSIGQSIAVTPIQLLRATAAVANGGLLMKPLVAREILDNKGNVVKKFEPQPEGRIMSPETSAQVRGLLENVVAKGTGINAFIEGYRVAGKTGTAQVVGEHGGYVSGRYVASFSGFAPADNPRFALLVMIAEPQGGVYYGGVVAAPVFQAIARDILHYMKIPETPGLVKPKDPLTWYEPPRVEVAVPNVVNYPVSEAMRILRQAGLSIQTTGEGSIVYGQVPEGGAKVMNGTTVLLDLSPPRAPDGGEKVTVPNLTGLTVEEAGDLLEELGLHLETVGTGLVEKQSPAPGTGVDRQSTVRLEFRPPGINEPSGPESAPPVMSWEYIMD
ncbi:MAG: stage V sporulation protein D [Peptococcaceae bacterium BRH_c4b]|nr:MAG: stage V sporulation protein D [Peptococcaceae bacterium BRH_c4b]